MGAKLIRWCLLWLMLVIASVLSGLACASSEPPGTFTIDAPGQQIWLDNQLSVYRDSTGELGFDEIRSIESRGGFEPVQGQAINSGLPAHKKLIWIHFSVRYPAEGAFTWWLLLTPDHLPTITLYAEQSDGHFAIHHGGGDRPFDQREMPGVGHGFKLEQAPSGVRHYFIRVPATLNARIEPSLWQEKALIDYLGRFRGTLGLYVGLISVLIVMALGRALRYRKLLDIAYFLYLLGFEVFNLGHNGFMQVSGLVESPSTRMALIQFGLFLSGFSFLTVTRTLISWPHIRWAWPDCLLGAGVGFTMTLLFVTAQAFPIYLLEVNFNQAVIWIVVSGLMGLRAAWKGYTNARLFVACFLPFVLWSTSISIMRWLEAPLPNLFTRYRILMLTSAIHLFTLWYLILSKEARLEQAKRQLEEQLTALRNEMSHVNLFLSALGHEINRPLTALAALIQEGSVLAEPVSELTRQPRLSAIHREFSDVLKTCTDQVRQTVVTQLDRKPVDLAGLVRGITEHFQLKTTTQLIRHDTKELPTKFLCDPRLVSILLINLVENALRYSPEGGAVWVSGKQMNADTIEISVTDEGPGIPASARERIFERYVQLDTTAPQQEGMGLGLFIVKRIAELHGGHVVCESEPGEGATFRVTLRAPE